MYKVVHLVACTFSISSYFLGHRKTSTCQISNYILLTILSPSRFFSLLVMFFVRLPWHTTVKFQHSFSFHFIYFFPTATTTTIYNGNGKEAYIEACIEAYKL